MTIIVALSLISWAVVLTIIAVGVSQNNENVGMTGAVFFIGLLTVHFSFSVGAFWQRQDTLEKYNLIEKSKP
jgi:hypothetical protein